MLRILLLIAAFSLGSRAERLPQQSDINHCILRTEELGRRALQGRIRIELMIRRDGKVYAAYVHARQSIENRVLEKCLCDEALLWTLTPVPIDYHRSYPIIFVNDTLQSMYMDTVAFLPDMNDPPPPEDIQLDVAQASLEVLGDASPAEQGAALLQVKRHGEAIRELRRALDEDPTNALALRELARALAESGGDPGEARTRASALIAIAPSSVAGHEAMVRVCLASGDDQCVVSQWRMALKADDLPPRSRILKEELEPRVRLAAARLNAPASPPQTDPCAAQARIEDRALCIARSCFTNGAALYARDLSARDGTQYTECAWRASAVAGSKALVTCDSSGGRHGFSARWVVTLTDSTTILPANEEARAIMLKDDACGARVRFDH